MPLLLAGSNQFEALVTWLASRQTAQLEEPDEDEDYEQLEMTETGSIDDRVRRLPNIEPLGADTIPCAGFNGRCNKYADTCYSFWNGATLMVRGRLASIECLLTRISDARPVFRGRWRSQSSILARKDPTSYRWIWKGARGSSW